MKRAFASEVGTVRGMCYAINEQKWPTGRLLCMNNRCRTRVEQGRSCSSSVTQNKDAMLNNHKSGDFGIDIGT